MRSLPATAHRPPKILHWMARKAGVSQNQAIFLWQQALRETAAKAKPGTPRFHSMVLDRLIELMAAEALHRRASFYRFGPGFRVQSRVWNMALNYAEQFNALTLRGLHTLFR
jgi:hypothetical protein